MRFLRYFQIYFCWEIIDVWCWFFNLHVAEICFFTSLTSLGLWNILRLSRMNVWFTQITCHFWSWKCAIFRPFLACSLAYEGSWSSCSEWLGRGPRSISKQYFEMNFESTFLKMFKQLIKNFSTILIRQSKNFL